MSVDACFGEREGFLICLKEEEKLILEGFSGFVDGILWTVSALLAPQKPGLTQRSCR